MLTKLFIIQISISTHFLDFDFKETKTDVDELLTRFDVRDWRNERQKSDSVVLRLFSYVIAENQLLRLEYHHVSHVWMRKEDLSEVVSGFRCDFLVRIAKLVDEHCEKKSFAFRTTFKEFRRGDDRLDLVHFLSVLQR